jgi:hypothetical protein
MNSFSVRFFISNILPLSAMHSQPYILCFITPLQCLQIDKVTEYVMWHRGKT